MRATGRAGLGRVGFWVVAACAAVLAGTALQSGRLAEAQHATMVSVQRYDLAWFASRTDHELSMLEVAAFEAAAGVGAPGDVDRWLDVARNRVGLLRERGSAADAAVADAVRRAADAVAAARGAPADAEVARGLVGTFKASSRAVGAYATAQHDAESIKDHEDAEALSEYHRAFERRLFGVVGCCALLLAWLGASVWRLDASSRRQAALAADLSATVAALDRRNAQFDATLNNTRQGVMMAGPDGVVALANAAFAAIFPEAGDVAGRRVAELAGRPGRLSRALGLGALAAGAQGDVDLGDGTTLHASCRSTGDGGLVVTFDDVTARRAADGRLRFLAHHDELTGLANRNFVDDRLVGVLAGAGGASVLAIDLDGFKAVNDGHGHEAGDEVLKAVAARVAAAVGEGDLVARMGGDEFAAVLLGPERDAVGVARRIVRSASEPIALEDGVVVEVGASVGVADYPDDGSDAREVMRSADLALYQAKAEGKGVVRVYDHARGAMLRERRALAADLRHAVERDELDVHYQPIVRSSDRAVAVREALVRWRHPTRGDVSPGDFIPVAEETGAIAAIGRWVMRRACADAAGWADGAGVAVNLSPVQFKDGSVLDLVAGALRDAGLPARRLEVEVTETSMIADDAAAQAMLKALQAEGVRISMDDFGTGYSSLAYLQRFRFDKVKVDQSFVRTIDAPESAAIVASMIGLAKGLGITTTAEGVETEAQARALAALGCDQYQGYLFGRPAPMPGRRRTGAARVA